MKLITMYACGFCKYQSTNRDETLAHEAEIHYNITPEEYKEWIDLIKSAEHAGAQVGISKNPTTDKEFDDRIQDLVQFETKHGLLERQTPNPHI